MADEFVVVLHSERGVVAVTFRRVVATVQVLALAATILTSVLLARPAPSTGRVSSLGASVFAANCASCHGSDGTGVIGPDLTTGHVFERFDSRADMLEFVTQGFGKMPAMGERLEIGEIGAVADFVRNELGS